MNDATEPAEPPAPPLTGKARALANLKPWKPGQSGNPAGRVRTISTTKKMRDLLARDSDLAEAVRVIELAEGPGAVDRWTVETLTNADLVALAMLGLALNRTGRVPPAVMQAAGAYIWDRMDGKMSDKTPGGAAEDENKPLMSIEDFRRAISMQAPPSPIGQDEEAR